MPTPSLLAAAAPPIVLASASAIRAQLLDAAGVPVAQRPAPVDELALKESLQAEGASAGDAAIALAELKAQQIARHMPDAIVLGADQILTCAGRWFDKPQDRAQARAHLGALAGRRHELATAVVAFRGGVRVWHHLATARLWLRPCSPGFLDAYLDATGDGYLTGRAPLAGVMGWPVAHSLSPRLHGHWLRRHRIDGAYVPLAVPPESLEQALRALPALSFAGVNLTIPHKEAAALLVDRLAPAAARIGAVNTVVVEPDGALVGDNTDGFGFIASLRESGADWRAEAGPAVVLGAGGAARAIAVALLDAGAPEVRLLNRTPDRAHALAQELGGAVHAVPWRERDAALDSAALLVNTTSLGMQGQPPLVLALDALPRSAVVTDVVYTALITALLAVARARGNPVVDGLGMLLHQARPGFRAWFGVNPAVDEDLRRAVLAGLAATG